MYKNNYFYNTNTNYAEGISVSLPHTWNAKDGQDGGNDYHRGTCWYRLALERPELKEGEKAYLEFDGAAIQFYYFSHGATPPFLL